MASIYFRAGKWYLNAREGGKRVRISLKVENARMARIALADFERRQEAGLVGVELRKTVDRRIAERMATACAYLKPSTVRGLVSRYARIGKFFGTGINQQRVDEFVAKRLAEGAAVGHINQDLINLNAIVMPADKVTVRRLKATKKTERIFLTLEETTRLLAELDGDCQAITVAYLLTGCRKEELRQLKSEDFTEHDGSVRIRCQKTYKTPGTEYRYVPIHPDLRPWVDARIGRKYPFALDRSKYFYPKYLKTAGVRAGIPINVMPKTLRCTFGSLLAQAGVPLQVISYLMGHSDIAMTANHYAHLTPNNHRAAVMQLRLQLGPLLLTGKG